MTHILTGYIQTILSALSKQHLHHVVIAPGSRSTPVALLLAQSAKAYDFELHVDVDERSAAFFALGLTKVTHEPTLLLCTSGTAAANFYPAIIEARLTHQPLVVLTTDRPPELTNIGAPQAIDQDHLYGNHVKHFLQLPLPCDDNDVLKYVAFSVQRIYAASKQAPKGPVHLNLPLRKPLMPTLGKIIEPITVAKIESIPSHLTFSLGQMTDLKARFANKRVLLVAGPVEDYGAPMAILKFAKQQNWPIIADILSNLRRFDHPLILSCGDAILKSSADFCKTLYPDIILRFGATPVSASLATWLKHSPVPVYTLDPNHALADHTKSTTHALNVDPTWFFQNFRPEPTLHQTNYTQRWQKLQNDYQQLIIQTFANETLSEGSVAYWCNQHITQGQIFLSNSMPIRDFESFFSPKSSTTKLYCNRGANGIDGVISTALGMTAATDESSFLVIGDLAFFHDMNGLMMAKRNNLDCTILVINNNGGGIFSFLPQASAKDYFESLFGTPQDLDIAAVAQLYHAEYHHPKDAIALQSLLQQSTKGLRIIEITTNRDENLKAHQQFQKQVEADLEN